MLTYRCSPFAIIVCLFSLSSPVFSRPSFEDFTKSGIAKNYARDLVDEVVDELPLQQDDDDYGDDDDAQIEAELNDIDQQLRNQLQIIIMDQVRRFRQDARKAWSHTNSRQKSFMPQIQLRILKGKHGGELGRNWRTKRSPTGVQQKLQREKRSPTGVQYFLTDNKANDRIQTKLRRKRSISDLSAFRPNIQLSIRRRARKPKVNGLWPESVANSPIHGQVDLHYNPSKLAWNSLLTPPQQTYQPSDSSSWDNVDALLETLAFLSND